MKLTPQQQDEIESSLWVVNTALKNLGLSGDEDMRQNAIIYMCRCLTRFDPTQNVKWTTFAYKNVYLYIKRLHKREIRQQSWETDYETGYRAECVKSYLEEPELIDDNKILLDKIRKRCNAPERTIIDLKLQGYEGAEISQITGCSVSKISKYMRSVKIKAREMVL